MIFATKVEYSIFSSATLVLAELTTASMDETTKEEITIFSTTDSVGETTQQLNTDSPITDVTETTEKVTAGLTTALVDETTEKETSDSTTTPDFTSIATTKTPNTETTQEVIASTTASSVGETTVATTATTTTVATTTIVTTTTAFDGWKYNVTGKISTSQKDLDREYIEEELEMMVCGDSQDPENKLGMVIF